MAHAFEYLFNRVVSSVDMMADLLPDANKIRGARKEATDLRTNMEDQLTRIPIPEAKQADYAELMKKLPHITEGSTPEAIKQNIDEVMKLYAKIAPNTAAATAAAQARNKTRISWPWFLSPDPLPKEVLSEENRPASPASQMAAAQARGDTGDAHPGSTGLVDQLASQMAKPSLSGGEHSGTVYHITNLISTLAVTNPHTSGSAQEFQQGAVVVQPSKGNSPGIRLRPNGSGM